MRYLLAIILATTLCAFTQPPPPAATQPAPPIAGSKPVPAAQRMKAEAQAMRTMVHTDLGRAFLDGAASLPPIATRTIYRDKKSREWFNESEMKAKLAADASLEFEPLEADEDRYYETKYGSPVAYARAFDLLGRTGRRDFAGMKVLDFGYGTIGHLRMLANQGAEVTGLDVDSFLTALYSDPSDTGVITNAQGEQGRITLVSGHLNDEKIRQQIAGAGGYDLIISKNTLKRGYVHPPGGIEVDERMLIDLGVDEATFLKMLFGALKPGGQFFIYNICPKQNDYQSGAARYLPMADGLCPWTREQLEAAGFRPVILNRDDSDACRQMARILGWDHGETPMDVDGDLFAYFTLVEKPS